MIEWPESKEQLLSQYCASSYRAKSAKTLKADLDYAVSIVSLIPLKEARGRDKNTLLRVT